MSIPSSRPSPRIQEQKKKDYSLWQYGLLSFQTGCTELEKFLLKNQHTQRILLSFKNWVNGGLRSFQKSEF